MTLLEPGFRNRNEKLLDLAQFPFHFGIFGIIGVDLSTIDFRRVTMILDNSVQSRKERDLSKSGETGRWISKIETSSHSVSIAKSWQKDHSEYTRWLVITVCSLSLSLSLKKENKRRKMERKRKGTLTTSVNNGTSGERRVNVAKTRQDKFTEHRLGWGLNETRVCSILQILWNFFSKSSYRFKQSTIDLRLNTVIYR